MTKTALIVAGGKGARMGSETPKQFLPLRQRPVLMRAMDAFYAYSPDIRVILVLHPAMREDWEELCEMHGFRWPHTVVDGGLERFHSVKNGLTVVDRGACVAIHDGARPLVSRRLIEEAFRLAEKNGSAVPVVPLNETIREIKEGSSRLVDRSGLFSVQTPQAFRAELIKIAYEQAFRPEFTDDAAVLESTGHKVRFFPGDLRNIKITRQEDLVLAQSWMMDDG